MTLFHQIRDGMSDSDRKKFREYLRYLDNNVKTLMEKKRIRDLRRHFVDH